MQATNLEIVPGRTLLMDLGLVQGSTVREPEVRAEHAASSPVH